MLTNTLIAMLFASSTYGSAISKSVFPNAACGSNGFIGVGSVGDEQHCSCSTDNLPNFVACPSVAVGETVCNSVLDLETGSFSAECSVFACSGSACPTTVVNTVTVDEADCIYQGQGFIGYSTVNGETKCACSSSISADAEDEEFTICPSPSSGRGICVTTDSDFLGQSLSHKETVKCGVVCDKDHFLTPGGSCTKHLKRAVAAGPSGTFHSTSGAIKIGPSATATAQATGIASSGPSKYNPSAHHHRPSATPSAEGTSIVLPTGPIKIAPSPVGTSFRHGASQHHRVGQSTNIALPTGPIKIAPSPASSALATDVPSSRYGASQQHRIGQSTNIVLPTGPIKIAPSPASTASATDAPFTRVGPSAIFSAGGATLIGPGPSQRARMARSTHEIASQEWVVEASQCSSAERSCPVGGYGDYACIRLDDITSCGGCESTGTAVNCMESIPGVKAAVCLRGVCTVRSCATGFSQTGESVCSAKA